MLDAIAQICADQGYGAASAGAVIARARVSSETFYEQFKEREDLFLAAYHAILAQILERRPTETELVEDPGDESIQLVLSDPDALSDLPGTQPISEEHKRPLFILAEIQHAGGGRREGPRVHPGKKVGFRCFRISRPASFDARGVVRLDKPAWRWG